MQRQCLQKITCRRKRSHYLAPPPPSTNPADVPVNLLASRAKSDVLANSEIKHSINYGSHVKIISYRNAATLHNNWLKRNLDEDGGHSEQKESM